MSENLRWYTKAVYGFDHVVRLAPAGAWDQPSPCEGWTARSVLGHVIAVQRAIEAIIVGVRAPLHPMKDPHLHPGDRPQETWAQARDATLAALDHPGVLHRVVTTFRGDESVDDLVGYNVLDTTVHAWDLARALGVDDRLDPGLVERARLTAIPVIESMRGPRGYAPTLEVEPGADVQTVMLALMGRAG